MFKINLKGNGRKKQFALVITGYALVGNGPDIKRARSMFSVNISFKDLYTSFKICLRPNSLNKKRSKDSESASFGPAKR